MTFGIHSKAKNSNNMRLVVNCASRSCRTNARELWTFACDVLREYVRKQRFHRQTVSMNFKRRLFFDVNQTYGQWNAPISLRHGVVTGSNHLQARFLAKRTRFERAANRNIRRRLDALSSNGDQTYGCVDIIHDGSTL